MGDLSTTAGWKLSPEPVPISPNSLEADDDPAWIRYYSPIAVCGIAPIQSYVRIHIPLKKEVTHINDQWITPGWQDEKLPDGAVWTDELVHFVVDNGVPLLADVLDANRENTFYNNIVKAGLRRRKAREDGQSDQFRGEGLDLETMFPYSLATLTISTEIKRLLPPEGVKWLFLRLSTTGVVHNRMDNDMIVMDGEGEVIATSHHTVMMIPYTGRDSSL